LGKLKGSDFGHSISISLIDTNATQLLTRPSGVAVQTSASRMRIIGPHCQEVSIEVLFRELWTYRSRLFATPRSRSFAHGTRTDRCPVTRERTSGGERPCPVSSCNQSFASPLARQLGNPNFRWSWPRTLRGRRRLWHQGRRTRTGELSRPPAERPSRRRSLLSRSEVRDEKTGTANGYGVHR